MTRSRFRTELPTSVRPRSSAELRSEGITRGQLQGPNWRQTSRGFYIPSRSAGTRDSPTQRIIAALPLIPADGALTGWAAAFVHGVDQMDGRDSRTLAPRPLTICSRENPGRTRNEQVHYLRGRLSASDVRVMYGIRVVSPVRAAFDGARLAETLEEAVVFLDACAHAGVIDLGSMTTYIARHHGWKGIRQAARAVELAHPATRSPGESRLRLCYVAEAQLPKPQVNLPIFDLEERLLGIGDLVDEEAGFVTEFDGGLHRQRLRHHDDNLREERLERAGLVVVRADTIDLTTDRAGLVRRLRAGHRDGLERDRRRDRWTLVEPLWWIEQQDPMLSLTDEERAAILASEQ